MVQLLLHHHIVRRFWIRLCTYVYIKKKSPSTLENLAKLSLLRLSDSNFQFDLAFQFSIDQYSVASDSDGCVASFLFFHL